MLVFAAVYCRFATILQRSLKLLCWMGAVLLLSTITVDFNNTCSYRRFYCGTEIETLAPGHYNVSAAVKFPSYKQKCEQRDGGRWCVAVVHDVATFHVKQTRRSDLPPLLYDNGCPFPAVFTCLSHRDDPYKSAVCQKMFKEEPPVLFVMGVLIYGGLAFALWHWWHEPQEKSD